jgi:hypothetical protein
VRRGRPGQGGSGAQPPLCSRPSHVSRPSTLSLARAHTPAHTPQRGRLHTDRTDCARSRLHTDQSTASLQPSTAVYSRLQQSTAVYSSLQPSTAVNSRLQPSTAIYSRLQPICSRVALSLAAVWPYPLQPCGLIRNEGEHRRTDVVAEEPFLSLSTQPQPAAGAGSGGKVVAHGGLVAHVEAVVRRYAGLQAVHVAALEVRPGSAPAAPLLRRRRRVPRVHQMHIRRPCADAPQMMRRAGRGPGRESVRDKGRGPGRQSVRDKGRGPGRQSVRDKGRGPGRQSVRDKGRGPGRGPAPCRPLRSSAYRRTRAPPPAAHAPRRRQHTRLAAGSTRAPPPAAHAPRRRPHTRPAAGRTRAPPPATHATRRRPHTRLAGCGPSMSAAPRRRKAARPQRAKAHAPCGGLRWAAVAGRVCCADGQRRAQVDGGGAARSRPVCRPVLYRPAVDLL